MTSRAWLGTILVAILVQSACSSRSETVLYVVNRGSDDVSAFIVDPDNGVLTPVKGSAFKAGSAPGAIAVAGRTLYVANQFSHDVAAYTIRSSGALEPVRGSPFPTEPFPTALAVGGGGRVLHVTSAVTAQASPDSTGRLTTYAIDATTGALSRLAGSPASIGTGPTSLAAAPAAGVVYVGNVVSRDLSAYVVDMTTGAAKEVDGSPFATEVTKYEAPPMVHPLTGRPLPLPSPSLEVPHTPTAVVAASSGRIVYVTAYAIAMPAPSAVSVMARPGGWSIRGSPRVGPAGVTSLSSVAAYTVDPASGALTRVDGSPWKAGRRPSGMAIDPFGRYAWVSNFESNDVSGYAITATTGALVPAPRPFEAGERPAAIVVDRSGRFVYVANAGSNDVSGYRVNATIGTLTPMPKSPFKAGSEPLAMAVTVTGIQ